MIKAIIVDAEISAGRFLKKLIVATCANVDIIGIANDIAAATILINEVKPDLIFLDIKMIQQNELSFFDSTKVPSFDIIITAKDENCAFLISNISAVHCIAKPVKAADLLIAVARHTLKAANSLLCIQQLAINISATIPIIENDKIYVFVDGNYLVLHICNIVCCIADGSYTKIYCKDMDKPYIVNFPLGVVQGWLPVGKFLRIHRSSLIGIDYMKSFNKAVNEVVLKNEMVLDIAANSKGSLLALMGNK